MEVGPPFAPGSFVGEITSVGSGAAVGGGGSVGSGVGVISVICKRGAVVGGTAEGSALGCVVGAAVETVGMATVIGAGVGVVLQAKTKPNKLTKAKRSVRVTNIEPPVEQLRFEYNMILQGSGIRRAQRLPRRVRRPFNGCYRLAKSRCVGSHEISRSACAPFEMTKE
jgi:hypothetical protein